MIGNRSCCVLCRCRSHHVTHLGLASSPCCLLACLQKQRYSAAEYLFSVSLVTVPVVVVPGLRCLPACLPRCRCHCLRCHCCCRLSACLRGSEAGQQRACVCAWLRLCSPLLRHCIHPRNAHSGNRHCRRNLPAPCSCSCRAALRDAHSVAVVTALKRVCAILVGVGISAATQTLVLPVLARRQAGARD